MLKQRTKDLARRFGVEISYYRPFTARVVARLNASGIPLVIDVGACRGEFATELRQRGYHGDIASFEPVAEAFARNLPKTFGNIRCWRFQRMNHDGDRWT